MARKPSSWYTDTLRDDARHVARETGLPVPLIRAAAAGRAELSRASLDKLYNYHRRENYRELREAGATPKEARALEGASADLLDKYTELRDAGANHVEAHLYATDPGKSFEEVEEHAADLKDLAREIWRGNKPDNPKLRLRDVIAGMRRSSRTADDWDMYVALRKKESWTDRRDPRSASVFGPTILSLQASRELQRRMERRRERIQPLPDFTFYPPDESPDISW